MNLFGCAIRPAAVTVSLCLTLNSVGVGAASSRTSSARPTPAASNPTIAWLSAPPFPVSATVPALIAPGHLPEIAPVDGFLETQRSATAVDVPLIYRLNDVHRDESAQRHLAGMLQRLVRNGGLDFIAVEGAWGPVNLSAAHRYADRGAIRTAASFLLHSGLISGPAFAALTSASFPALIGVDDPAAYQANVAAYREAVESRPALLAWIASSEGSLVARRPTLTPALRAAEAALVDFWAGRMSIGRYYERLFPMADARRYPATAALRTVLMREAQIDFRALRDRRRALLTDVAERSPAALAVIARAADACARGQISVLDFHDRLIAAAEPVVPRARLVFLKNYVDYARGAESVNASVLASERLALEQDVLLHEAQSPLDQRFVVQTIALRLTEHLAAFSFTPDDWAFYRALPADQRPPPAIAEPFERFYRLVEKRDRLMADRVLALMVERNSKRCAVVAGGFHGAGMGRRFSDAGQASVAMTPRLARVDVKGAADYLTAFTQRLSPLELLVQGRDVHLALPPYPRLGDRMLATVAVAAAERANGRAEIPSTVERVESQIMVRDAAFWVTAADTSDADRIRVSIHAGPAVHNADIDFKNGDATTITARSEPLSGVIQTAATWGANAMARYPAAFTLVDTVTGWPATAPDVTAAAVRWIGSPFRNGNGHHKKAVVQSVGDLIENIEPELRMAGQERQAVNLHNAVQPTHHHPRGFPEFENRPIKFAIGTGRATLAETDGETVFLDEIVLDHPALLKELVGTELRHISFRFLLRSVWGQMPTLAEEAAEEIDNLTLKINAFQVLTIPQQVDFLLPLVDGGDSQGIHRILLAMLPPARMHRVINRLFSLAALRSRTDLHRELYALGSIGKRDGSPTSPSALIVLVTNFFRANNTYPHLTAYLNETSNPEIVGSVVRYHATLKKLRSERQKRQVRRVPHEQWIPLTTGVYLEPRSLSLGAPLTDDGGANRLLDIRSIFRDKRVVAMEPHIDDLVFAMGATMRVIADVADSVEIITANPDDLGVTNEYIEKWVSKNPALVPDGFNGEWNEDNRRILKRMIRQMEALASLKLLGFSSAHYRNLDIGLPLVPGKAVYRDGELVPQESEFEPLTADDRSTIQTAVRNNIRADIWLLPFPFRPPRHPHHRAFTDEFLTQLAEHGFKGTVIFYETTERANNFDIEGVDANLIFGFDQKENAAKIASMATMVSQESRKTADRKYTVVIPARSAERAELELRRLRDASDNPARESRRFPFAERFVSGKLHLLVEESITRSASGKRGGRWEFLNSLYNAAGSGVLGQALLPTLIESAAFVLGGAWLTRAGVALAGQFDSVPNAVVTLAQWVSVSPAMSFLGSVVLFQIAWHLLHRDAFSRDRIAISVGAAFAMLVGWLAGTSPSAAFAIGLITTHLWINANAVRSERRTFSAILPRPVSAGAWSAATRNVRGQSLPTLPSLDRPEVWDVLLTIPPARPSSRPGAGLRLAGGSA